MSVTRITLSCNQDKLKTFFKIKFEARKLYFSF